MELHSRTQTSNSRYGVSDLPIRPSQFSPVNSLDKLEIASYYNGLAEFVHGCVTPMTIAVQGTWGSGKTSALYSIRESLNSNHKDELDVVYINTWQYSLFHSNETLVFSVLNRIIETFQQERDSNRKSWPSILSDYDQLLTGIKSSVTKLAKFSYVTMGAVKGVDLTSFAQSEEIKASSDELLDLKQRFEELVNAYCKHNQKSKIVFFIDDLDRLEPSLAIELLEVFKVLLDVSNTVFVLAIDFDIVKLGIEQRYFHSAGGNEQNEWKARSFFDKIVQVPFNMPTAAYEPKLLIKEHIGKEIDNDEDQLRRYETAVRSSVGVNPRAIKRLINAYTLTKIISQLSFNTEEEKELLYRIFLLIAMEVAYPKAYQDLTVAVTTYLRAAEENMDNSVSADAQKIVEQLLLVDDELALTETDLNRWGIRPDGASQFLNFLYLLKSEFEVSNDNSSNDEGWTRLEEALRLTVVTSVNTEASLRSDGSALETTIEKLRYQGIYSEEGTLTEPAILKFERAMERLIRKRRFEDNLAFKRGAVIAPVGYKEQPNYSAYLAESASELQGLKARSRPKFLALRQNKGSFQVGFGSPRRLGFEPAFKENGSFTQHQVENWLPAFTADWHPIIRRIANDGKIPYLNEASSKKVEFGFTLESSVSPILIKGITTQEHVDLVLEYFEEIYETALKSAS